MHARRAIALGMVGTALLTAGCGGGDAPDAAQDTAWFTSVKAEGSETSSTAETTEPSAGRPEDTGAAWKREYEWVLEHPDDYPVNSAAQYTPGGASKYAIVEATGGGTPELLLAVGQGHTNPVIVFAIGPDGKAVWSGQTVWASASRSPLTRAGCGTPPMPACRLARCGSAQTTAWT